MTASAPTSHAAGELAKSLRENLKVQTSQMRYLPTILLCVSILLAPLIWHFSAALFKEEKGPGMSSVDSAARIELEMMRGTVDQLVEKIAAMEARIDVLSAPPAAAPTQGADTDFDRDGRNDIIDSYAQVVLVADRRLLNAGLIVPTPAFLEEFLGRPREDINDQCQGMTHPRLREMLVLEDVGPIRVNMLKPAVKSLRKVFEAARAVDQDLYDRINTSGSLCVRRIRGSVESLSSHSFGLAVDLNIDGVLDNFADGRTQLGLTILADLFQAEGWIWGAGFGREDSMHFEVSRELLESWRERGEI